MQQPGLGLRKVTCKIRELMEKGTKTPSSFPWGSQLPNASRREVRPLSWQHCCDTALHAVVPNRCFMLEQGSGDGKVLG